MIITIKNETSVTIQIEVISHTRSPELVLKPLNSKDFNVFEVTNTVHVFSEIGSCVSMVDNYHKTLENTKNFGKLVLEKGYTPSNNYGLLLNVREKT